MVASRTIPISTMLWLTACSGGEPAAPSTPTARPDAAVPAAIETDPQSVAGALVPVPALTYRPLFRGEDEPETVSVAPFAIEEHAVTNRQFLAFVLANPKWRRSHVTRLFADEAYLTHWQADDDPGADLADRPVTHVSWFAARAYARWIGRRLPTVVEWEAVGAASVDAVDGREEPGYVQRILDWYARKTPPVPPTVRSTIANYHGVWDLHGVIWEWTEDFNTALVTGESRGDTGLERNLFCGAGSVGAADPADYAAFMRYAFRSSLDADYTIKNLGFRCAAEGSED